MPFPEATAVEKELEYLHKQGSLQYVIYVKRTSRHGTLYMKGLVIVKDEDAHLPEVMELKEIPLESAHHVWMLLKSEQELEDNATEHGSPSNVSSP